MQYNYAINIGLKIPTIKYSGGSEWNIECASWNIERPYPVSCTLTRNDGGAPSKTRQRRLETGQERSKGQLWTHRFRFKRLLMLTQGNCNAIVIVIQRYLPIDISSLYDTNGVQRPPSLAQFQILLPGLHTVKQQSKLIQSIVTQCQLTQKKKE